MDAKSFAYICGVLSRLDLEIDGSYLEAKMFPELSREIFAESMKEIGYLASHDLFDRDRLFIDKGDASKWNGSIPFFDSKESFWAKIKSSFLPENYFIVSEKLSSIERDSNFIDLVKLYFLWSKVIENLADHVEQGVDKVKTCLYYIGGEDVINRHSLRIFLSLSNLSSIENSKDSLIDAQKMLDALEMGDLHASERREVMRTSFSYVLSEFEGDDLFFQTIQNISKILSKYNDQYELYVHRFSVNKILIEIDELNMEYVSKVNDFVSSSQTKALTIPGAIAAVGGLVKSVGILESVLIVIGLYLVFDIVRTANQIQREAYDDLVKRLTGAMEKYVKLDSDAEVKKSAESSTESIMSLVGRAKGRLRVIDRWSLVMLVGGTVYLVVKYFTDEKNNLPSIFLPLICYVKNYLN